MIKRLFGMALTALLLSGCAESEAKGRVKELLNDSTSAEFSDVYSQAGVTCGFVNAKNRLGAFTGPQAFIVQDGIAEIVDDIPSDSFLNDLSTKCDERVFERYSRTILNDLQVNAARSIREK